MSEPTSEMISEIARFVAKLLNVDEYGVEVKKSEVTFRFWLYGQWNFYIQDISSWGRQTKWEIIDSIIKRIQRQRHFPRYPTL